MKVVPGGSALAVIAAASLLFETLTGLAITFAAFPRRG
jgi:hypothetical protein